SAGLAGSGRHDQQGAALAGVEMRSHLRDRSLLVRAPGDLRVDARAAQGATLHASAMELLELAAGVEPLDRTGGIAGSTVPGGVVPDLVLPPVGQEDDRPL